MPWTEKDEEALQKAERELQRERAKVGQGMSRKLVELGVIRARLCNRKYGSNQ